MDRNSWEFWYHHGEGYVWMLIFQLLFILGTLLFIAITVFHTHRNGLYELDRIQEQLAECRLCHEKN